MRIFRLVCRNRSVPALDPNAIQTRRWWAGAISVCTGRQRSACSCGVRDLPTRRLAWAVEHSLRLHHGGVGVGEVAGADAVEDVAQVVGALCQMLALGLGGGEAGQLVDAPALVWR